jgi:glyoxylase I family protein
VLGFNIVEETKDFHGREYNTWIKNEDVIIELQTPKRSEDNKKYKTGNKGLMHICFRVNALKAFVEEIEENGFKDFLPGKRIYKVKDKELSKLIAPEGTIIELRE